MNGRGALACQAPPLGEITHSDLSANWRDGALPRRGERFARALALSRHGRRPQPEPESLTEIGR